MIYIKKAATAYAIIRPLNRGDSRRTTGMKNARVAVPMLALCLLSTAHAANVRGTVTSVDGDPVAGAVVSLTRADGALRQSVYSDASGHFLLATEQSAAARLSVGGGYDAASPPLLLRSPPMLRPLVALGGIALLLAGPAGAPGWGGS